MKKLLSILSAVTITTSSATTVVACGGKTKTTPSDNKGDGDNNVNEDGDNLLTELQNQMIDGAEIISRIIIASRHENLNFNVNEMLSMFFTPEATLMRMPQSYDYEGKNYNINNNLSKYKNLLAPSLTTLDQDNYAGMYASYVMGMYDNDFYAPIINGEKSFNDTMNINGGIGFNKENDNATGYLAGLNKNIKLSSNQERRDLAWGIQDTGALTNYLLDKGFDGGTPGDTRAAMGFIVGNPASAGTILNGGTNGGGYAFYNSLMQGGTPSRTTYKKVSVSDKLTSLNAGIDYKAGGYFSGLSSITDDGEPFNFGEVGGSLIKAAQANNINGGVALFNSMLENLSTTNSGALLTGEFSNYILPVMVSEIDADRFMQGVAFSLLSNVWKAIYDMAYGTNAIKAKALEFFGQELIDEIKDLDKNPNYSIGSSNSSAKKDEIGFDALLNFAPKDKINPGTNLVKVIEILNKIIDKYDNSNDKEDFVQSVFKAKGIIANAYSTIISNFVTEETWNEIMDGDSGIDLLHLAKGAFEMVLDEDIQKTVASAKNKYSSLGGFRNLTAGQKQDYINILGYNGSGYKENSYLDKIYKGFKDETIIGQKEIEGIFKGFKNKVNIEMKDIHEKVFQYILDDKYWDKKDVKVSGTSNLETSGSLEFSLDYKGVGDSTSNASSQYKKVRVDEDFNPYQTILSNQTSLDTAPTQDALDKIDANRAAKSGKVLGVEQGLIDKKDLIAYDGTGLFENMKDVNFEYKVKWENVSTDRDNPYWVMTSMGFYNNGTEFYNIY
ncbi:hypothetical protein SCHIN_v1c05830 [Spiroplasma chinense]|uniref:Lipoprotein n=1 Tax=Spiroplasma chinense TaxID=216932 RepID=A0A5B9Y498_9MOLU|nr:lipoprotein [Spiroplasma chinense]QEH61780.1 hypothetical protein SCHIN_v1c05830 [Spiroplasma chinense]